jgi:hypothetical protein
VTNQLIVKNRIIFGPAQHPCKQNQNKSVSRHKKPPMSQKRKENTQTPLSPLPKINRKHSQPPAALPKELGLLGCMLRLLVG